MSAYNIAQQLFTHNDTKVLQFVNQFNLDEASSICAKQLISHSAENPLTKACYPFFVNPNNTKLIAQLIKSKAINISNFLLQLYEIENDDYDMNNSATSPFVQIWWVQLVWSLIFGIMVCLAIIGNLIIILIIANNHNMKTITNIFLFNLTLSDLLSITFNAIFNFVFMLNRHWPFGEFYCVFNNFISNLTIASSVFTITFISIDRYMAIVHPLKPHLTKRKAIYTIIVIWVSAAIFALPSLIYSQTLTMSYNRKETRTLCLLYWPDGPTGESTLDYIYNIVYLLLTYIVPMLTMAITYSLMGRVLWGSKSIGEITQAQKQLIRSKQKVVRMLICVVTVFGVCWLPYHAYFLCTYHWQTVIKYKYIQHIYLAIYWLAMANSLLNPVILLLMNKRFARHFHQYLLRFCLIGTWINTNHLTNRPNGLSISQRIHSDKRNKLTAETCL